MCFRWGLGAFLFLSSHVEILTSHDARCLLFWLWRDGVGLALRSGLEVSRPQRRSRERKALSAASAQRGAGLALREGGSVALGARVGPLGSGVLDVRSGRVTFIDGSWGFELSREVFFWRCYGSRTRLPEVENEAIPPSSVVRIGPSGRGLVSFESALESSLF